jgi:hypothetical protein
VYEGNILDLTPETLNKTEFCFSATVFLTLIIDFRGDFLFENLRGLRVLENLVLTERKELLETVLRDGKSNDEPLPWEERTIEGAS